MPLPRFRLRTLMIVVAIVLAVIGGPMNQAVAQVGLFAFRRGGWSKDPFWWRLEFAGLATVLILCAMGFAWNRITRHRDQEAHDRADHIAEPDRVDDLLKDL